MTTVFHSILHSLASIMEIPVIVLLICFAGFAVFSLGWLAVEYFTEFHHMKVDVPEMLDDLRSGDISRKECIKKSTLLKRQKKLLLELGKHPGFSGYLLRSMADNLIEAEQTHYDRILKRTDLFAKLAPMLGLLGTLIPLGPGIIALGQGNTAALSASLLTAFDTTIAGLTVAGIFLVVSMIRRRWYTLYMSNLETLADCLIELQGREEPGETADRRNEK